MKQKLKLQHAAFIALACWSAELSAESLQVTAFNRQGKAAAGVTVCAGSDQERAIYHIGTTDSAGIASIDNLPEGKVVITVSDNDGGKAVEVIPALSPQLMIALPREKNSITCQRGRR